jgi:gliding motility-associated-like protein
LVTEPNSRDQRDLPAGTYQVNVVDAEYLCQLTDSFDLVQPDSLYLVDTSFSNYNNFNITCAGTPDGSISVIAGGGFYHASDPYTYDWRNLDGGRTLPSSDTVSDLNAGFYELTVTDSLGCFRVDTFEMVEPDTLTATWIPVDRNGVNISCFGDSDGEIDTTIVSGGIETIGYTYFWTRENDDWTSAEVQPTGLLPDVYTLLVVDANGCQVEFRDSVTEPEAPIVIGSMVITTPTCAGISNGAIRIDTITGGTPNISTGIPNYTILWTPSGDTTKNTIDVPKGDYTIEVWDLNGCYVSMDTTIGEPLPFKGSIDTISLTLYNNQMISCFGESDAVLGVFEPEGGTKPYSYQWAYSDGGSDTTAFSTDSIIYDRPIGFHRVVLTDALGCEFRDSMMVTQPDRFTSQSFIEDAICYNEPSGSINFRLAGGTKPYEYRWLSGETEPDITNLLAGEYYIVAQDINNCVYDTTLVVDQPTELVLNDTAIAPLCPDSYDGYIELRPSGGVPPYTTYIDGQATDILSELGPKDYPIEVIDANFCITVDTVYITADAETCLEIPSAFTPNADGYNDRWEIEGMIYYPDATVKIFNRWGELIFETREYYDKPWDGTYKGVAVPVDSYHYVISFTNGNAEIAGYVTVLK